MKKRKILFTAILILVLTLIITPHFLNYPKKGLSLETYAAYNNKNSSGNLVESKGLFSFINDMLQDEGDFASMRIDLSMHSLDQTYYYIKINEMLDNEIDDYLLNSFNETLVENLDDDPFLYAYLDTLKINSMIGSVDIRDKLEVDLEGQLQCSNCLDVASPYIIFHLLGILDKGQDRRSTEMLSEFILQESNEENLIYYLFWYLTLIEDNYQESTLHKDILNLAENLIKQTSLGSFSDPQTIYNLYKISAMIEKPYIVSENYIKSITDKINRTFDLQKLYFNLKFLEIYENGISKEYKDKIDTYFQGIVTLQAPMVVVERNNLIEMINWQMITSFLMDSEGNDLTNHIRKTIEVSKPTSSQTEMYYQALFFKLNNFSFPQKKVDIIRQDLKLEKELVENYYLFQAGSVLGYELSENQIDNLKSETKAAMETGEVWELITSLDLNFAYNKNRFEMKRLWEQSKEFLEKSTEDMNEKSYFLYQVLRFSMGEKLNKDEIDNYYNVRSNGDMLLIEGDTAMLELASIYSYLSLLNLEKIQNKSSRLK